MTGIIFLDIDGVLNHTGTRCDNDNGAYWRAGTRELLDRTLAREQGESS